MEGTFRLEFAKDQIAFAGRHAAFDELDDGAFHVMCDAAEDHSESGR
jgi:hypothetical protein